MESALDQDSWKYEFIRVPDLSDNEGDNSRILETGGGEDKKGDKKVD